MTTIKSFEDLEIWQAARQLSAEIYKATQVGSFAKDYGLRDQIRKSAISVLSNIAEGFERDGNKEFVQFLSISKGSLGELQAQLYIALDQQYIERQQFIQLQQSAADIAKRIGALMAYLKKSNFVGTKRKSLNI
jgi:four helix bundle protein